MSKAIFNIIPLFLLFFVVSCNKKVCPAYFSSFQPKQGTANKFFAYFEPEGETEEGEDMYVDDTFLAPDFGADSSLIAQEDTFKNRYGLLVFSDGSEPILPDVDYKNQRNKNGVVKKDNFLSNIFSSPRKRRNANKPKRVSTKNPRPFKVEEVDEDSTHQIVQKKEPPKLADQLYYEMEFGDPDAVDSTAVETQNAGDSLATATSEEALEEETDKKGKKKKKKKRKREKKRKKKDKATTEEDFSDTEIISEDVVLPEKKKKKKKKKADEESKPEGDT